ncbi:GIY-YIG nuclease family protein [Bradyrhizobium sp.]|uniref:GIY-YIG nuclease family protein n=1 Tax=Bradyrhizobium sp. TaxID=376 RepID=UPI003C6EB253
MFYIIRSISSPDQEHTGATADLKRRISDHNAGKGTHIAKFKPWRLVWYCAFPDKYKAWNSRSTSNPIPAEHLRRNACGDLTCGTSTSYEVHRPPCPLPPAQAR